MVGCWSRAVVGSVGIAGSGSSCWSVDRDGVGIALAVRLRVIASVEEWVTVAGSADSAVLVVVVVSVLVVGSQLTPLRGIQPFSALCIAEVGADGWPRSVPVPVLALVSVAASLAVLAVGADANVLVRPGDEVERVRAGGSDGGAVSERCRWLWV